MAPSSPETPGGDRAQDGIFATTRWSVVLAARGQDGAQEALNWLCKRYWFPLYAAARGRGASPHDAEDLVQGFFMGLLDGHALAAADKGRGRFRAFLMASFNNYSADQHRAAQAKKRGGSQTFVPIDEAVAEARFQKEFANRWTPDLDFDRAWALTLVDRALERLRSECEAAGDGERFAATQSFLTGVKGETPLAEAAARLKLSVDATKALVFRMRKRFRVAIMDEIRHTVASDDDVETEQRHLLEVLSR